jgi:hypothetical protein
MKTARQLSVCLLLLIGAISIYGGIHLVTDPTGSSLHFPFYLLNGSMFTDYLLMGWILLVTVGVFSLVIAAAMLNKHAYYSFMMMVQGAIICVYVLVMMLLLGETFMIEYIFLVLAIALIGLGVLQNQRKIAVEAQRRVNPQPKSHHHKHRKK